MKSGTGHMQMRNGRLRRWVDHGLDAAMRLIPVGAIVAIGAFVAAQQAVTPHRRVIKLGVLAALLMLMFRFDMVWSVYLFTALFPFPSGISIGSTNMVLMTLIPMIWAVRASSQRQTLFFRGPLDAPIGLFLIAYILSMFKVSGVDVAESVGVIWLQVTAIGFFYMITRFVDDEQKLVRLGLVLSVVCGLVMATAVLELLAPGATIIPGWIGLQQHGGEGMLRYRVEGLRVGGAFGSHGMLSDFGTQVFIFMVYFLVRARNPIARLIWALIALTTVVAVQATANRGAGAGFALACTLAFLLFRSRLSFPVQVMVVLGGVGLFLGAEMVLQKYTVAASLIDRFTGTEFEGVVPENRIDTWLPAIRGALESPFVGHGPWYNPGVGLERKLWPHNAYLFYFYTIGIFGLGVFVWILYRVWRCTMIWRRRELDGTVVGDMSRIAFIWLATMALEQMRTDHQRDDIYPYIVWMCFGFGVAAWNIARRRIADMQRGAPT